MKIKTILLSIAMIYPIEAISGPLGSNGVSFMKYIRDAPNGGQFFSVKCKNGTATDVLFESFNGNQWFLVPPSEPLAFYRGNSPSAFAEAACKTQTSSGSPVLKITGGVGSTASGIKSYSITCRNGVTYEMQVDRFGEWFSDELNSRFGRYRNLSVRDFATKFCSSR